MRNIKLILAYDGTNYCGFQRQINGITVQEVLEKQLSRLAKEEIKTISAGRTDSGVHAKGQVVNFLSNWRIPIAKVVQAINSDLPRDILILEAQEADLEFHARYCALSKAYSYQLWNDRAIDPFKRLYFGHIDRPLDIAAMQQAIYYFIGKHDFDFFKSAGACTKTSERTITQAEIKADGAQITFYFRADGFLYKQVRRMTGAVIEAGLGKIKPEDILTMLEQQNFRRSVKTAVPQGLYLEKVWYQ